MMRVTQAGTYTTLRGTPRSTAVAAGLGGSMLSGEAAYGWEQVGGGLAWQGLVVAATPLQTARSQSPSTPTNAPADCTAHCTAHCTAPHPPWACRGSTRARGARWPC